MLTIICCSIMAAGFNAAETVVSPAVRDERGVLVHDVTSPYQAGTTQIQVLLPENLDAGRRYPVIYVLPVEAGTENRYGDGMFEVWAKKLHNVHAAIFVAPTFSHLPWYVDHPTDPEIRQETYFLKVVVPHIEKTYPADPRREARLLLGFSKSGWGAWSLLLRHPDTFGRAAAWDAPLMMTRLGRYGTTPIFGDQATLDKVQIPDLLRSRSNDLGTSARLILAGYQYQGFRDHHVQADALLNESNVPHVYRDDPRDKHDWHSGWVAPTVGLLLAPVGDKPKP